MLTPSIAQVAACLSPLPTLAALRDEFRRNGQADSPKLVAPLRSHHVIEAPNKQSGAETHLLTMPAWEMGGLLGIKIVGVNALNPSRKDNPQPMVQGIYLLMDSVTGAPLAQFDAQELTFRRTAAVSALAGDYLARQGATHLGLIGAGAALAPFVVEMYRAIRPIEKVSLWNRTASKSFPLAEMLKGEGLDVEVVSALDQLVEQADIVSSCTPSPTPIIKGALLKSGCHVDCIGGFRPTMREADDETLVRARICVDTLDGVLQEAGDIILPLANGVIQRDDILGDLFDLCSGRLRGRTDNDDITFFKNVGSALSDLAAAKLVYECLSNNGIDGEIVL